MGYSIKAHLKNKNSGAERKSAEMKRSKRITGVVLVLLTTALVVLAMACSNDATEHGGEGPVDDNNAYLEAAPKDALYLIKMVSFAYEPSVLEVKTGEVLEIAIQNVDHLLHDFTIDRIDADVHISYLGGTGQHAHNEPEAKADVHFALTEPGSGVVHIKIHEPGSYVIYCTVPGHREAGMKGLLVVTSGDDDHDDEENEHDH